MSLHNQLVDRILVVSVLSRKRGFALWIHFRIKIGKFYFHFISKAFRCKLGLLTILLRCKKLKNAGIIVTQSNHFISSSETARCFAKHRSEI